MADKTLNTGKLTSRSNSGDKTLKMGKLRDFYQELEQLLHKQLETQPDLDDVRMKLLELYFEQQRPEEFLKAARAWHRRIRKPAESRDWQRVASMGRMLHPGDQLFAGAGSDRIEFVGGAAAPAPQETPQIRRFGDEPRYEPLFHDLAGGYEPVRTDPKFGADLELLLVSMAYRRPTPLAHMRRLSKDLGGAQIYIKREDLAGEFAHLTIALTGQALLARWLKRRILVMGVTDGRRAVLAATIAARMGFKMVIFMDNERSQREAANVLFARLMGAELKLVKASQLRNGDIREAGLDFWHKNPEDAFMLTGLDAAPAPYSVMTQEFTAAIGRECSRQFAAGKRRPDVVVTRGVHSADALGVFPAFIHDANVRLVCVEPETKPEADPRKTDDPYKQTGLSLNSGERKIAKRILEKLEYPSVSREHALLRASGRVDYVATSRDAARSALLDLARCEGLVPAIETAHALAWVIATARTMNPQQAIVLMMSESVDKDAWDINELVGKF